VRTTRLKPWQGKAVQTGAAKMDAKGGRATEAAAKAGQPRGQRGRGVRGCRPGLWSRGQGQRRSWRRVASARVGVGASASVGFSDSSDAETRVNVRSGRRA
jgi:hypothetical protein